jgi:hypothetical protein
VQRGEDALIADTKLGYCPRGSTTCREWGGMRLLLCTSIPPLDRQIRFDHLGRDVSREYLQMCATTWIGSSDHVLSVNSIREQNLGIEELGVEVVYCEQDFYETTGRPLVGLDQLLAKLDASESYTHVAIVNADVYLDAKLARDLHEQLSSELFVAEQRVDTGTLESNDGTAYHHGYDYFVLSREQAMSLRGSPFAIGMPWWDHFIPVALVLQGYRRLESNESLAFSLVHEERWDNNQWRRFGKLFLKSVRRQALSSRSGSRLWTAVVLENAATVLRIALAEALSVVQGKRSKRSVTRQLQRLAHRNVQLVNDAGHRRLLPPARQ